MLACTYSFQKKTEENTLKYQKEQNKCTTILCVKCNLSYCMDCFMQSNTSCYFTDIAYLTTVCITFATILLHILPNNNLHHITTILPKSN